MLHWLTQARPHTEGPRLRNTYLVDHVIMASPLAIAGRSPENGARVINSGLMLIQGFIMKPQKSKLPVSNKKNQANATPCSLKKHVHKVPSFLFLWPLIQRRLGPLPGLAPAY